MRSAGAGKQAPGSPSIHLQWRSGQQVVTWAGPNGTVHKRFPAPPWSVTSWPEPASIVVVEQPDRRSPRPDNAVVLDLDGTERLRVRPPELPEVAGEGRFYVIYPRPSGLVAVVCTGAGPFWGRVDPSTGELRDLSPCGLGRGT